MRSDVSAPTWVQSILKSAGLDGVELPSANAMQESRRSSDRSDGHQTETWRKYIRILSLDLHVLLDLTVSALNSPMMTRSTSSSSRFSSLHSLHSSCSSRYWMAVKGLWQGLLAGPGLQEQPCARNCATCLPHNDPKFNLSTGD